MTDSLAIDRRRWTFIYLSTPGTVTYPNILFGYKIQENKKGLVSEIM